MKNNHLDDKGQFKMRLDEEEGDESPIINQVGDLRFEKLNTRVTMISILIPVLIVMVLGIAYLDMKKRVSHTEKRVNQTENTGQLTAQSLAEELDSRFDTLTKSQKVVDENVMRLKDQSNKSLAKVQISLKKLDDRVKKFNKSTVSQKSLRTTKAGLDQNINNLAQSIDAIKVQLGQVTDNLEPRFSGLETALAENKSNMAKLTEQIAALDARLIDKPKLDTALKIEMLKIKTAYEDQFADLFTRIKALENRAARPSSTPSASTTRKPPAPAPSNSSPTVTPKQIEEQTIGK